MKKDILKIAGVKSEKEFYENFPTEEAFMAKHRKAFKKAAMGKAMVNKQLTQVTDFSNPPIAQDGKDIPEYQYSGQPLRGYQPMGLPDSRYQNIVDPSVYDITGMNRYYAKPLIPQSNTKQTTNAVAKAAGASGDISGVMEGIQNLVGGAQQWSEDDRMLKKYKMWGNIADLSGKAMTSRDRIKNKYVRPEDIVFNPNQVSPSYGTGYDVLGAAEDGAEIGGNQTEIQNTYNPGDIYSDLGYVPIDNNSGKIKQFANGGGMFANWQDDLTDFGATNAGSLGGTVGNFVGGGHNKVTGTSKTLTGVGQLAGTAIGGPLGGVVGGAIGGLVGGFFDSGKEKKMQQQQQRIDTLGGTQNIVNFQNRNHGFMEDGGWVSNDWQPQVITKFGDYDVKDLFAPDKTMDTLRAGGHLKNYTAPSEEAMQTAAFGGQLTLDGPGKIEFMGYNPVTAATGASGEIGISRGPSHAEQDRRGDGHKTIMGYGGNEVNIEGGETIMEKKDGGSIDADNSAIVLGDMHIGNQGEAITADVNKETLKKILNGKDLKNMKFKHLGNAIAKKTKSLNKAESKYIDLANSADDNSKFGLLESKTAEVGQLGVRMQYKDLHNLQTGAIDLQTAYHDTAAEYGYDDTPKFLEDIKKGKLKKQAAMGGKFSMAQDGKLIDIPLVRDQYGNPLYNQPMYGTTLPEIVIKGKKPSTSGKPTTTTKSTSVEKRSSQPTSSAKQVVPETTFTSSLNDRWNKYLPEQAPNVPIPYRSIEDANAVKNLFKKINTAETSKESSTSDKSSKSKKDRITLKDIYNAVSPSIRPLIQNPLDPSAYAGELYALSQNAEVPVYAQTIVPQLETPYSVSFQDQMNANQADFNAMAQRLGNNPAALSALAAQKYAANSNVLGQQFRANQELKMGAYNRNVAMLNDINLKNLGIRADQADKQAKAKANTKLQNYEALSSMADKFARNRAETLAANVESMKYPDYTFGPKGRIYKTGLTQFNIPTISDYSSADLQKLLDAKKVEESKKTKNGSIVKAIKNL